jgi:hypothetical protein
MLVPERGRFAKEMRHLRLKRSTQRGVAAAGGARPASPSLRAFEVIAATPPLGSVGYENEVNEKGERSVWLEPHVVNRLGAICGPGESYSDAILRLSSQTG